MRRKRLKPNERTERRVQMFLDRGIFKQKTDVMDAAVELLMRHQMELDSIHQAEAMPPCQKRSFLKAVRNQLNFTASFWAAVPYLFAGKDVYRLKLDQIRTKPSMYSSPEEAFKHDLEMIGLDMHKALSKFEKVHGEQ